jgi:hypothetical protein
MGVGIHFVFFFLLKAFELRAAGAKGPFRI